MNSMKRQKDRTLKDELPPRSVGVNMLLEISGEITPERMKRWSQSKNNSQWPTNELTHPLPHIVTFLIGDNI